MHEDYIKEAIAKRLREGTGAPPPSTVIICRNCGEEPAWAKDVFCVKCRGRLHEQVGEFLAQH